MIYEDRHDKKIRLHTLFVMLVCSLIISACTFAHGDIVISKIPDTGINVSKSPKFDPTAYRSILVVLPDAYDVTAVTTAGGGKKDGGAARDAAPDDESDIPHPTLTLTRSQDYDFIVNEAEHFLLQRGYNIISRDIIAKIDEVESLRYGKKSYLAETNAIQKILLLGPKTNADAMLVVSHTGAWPTEMNFLFNDDSFTFQTRPKPQNAEGIWISYHLWEVTMELKLIDIRTGEVVWMASGRHNSRNLFPADWNGKIKVRGDEVILQEENFRIEDFNTYNYLYKQVSVLERSLLDNLK